MESGNFKDNCQLVVCYCVSSDHAYRNSMELFIPIVHAVRHNSQPCSIEKYFDKMAASYMARIPQSRSSSCGSNSAYSRCTSMILYQINCCFTVDYTQQHFNFSVSFSFNEKSEGIYVSCSRPSRTLKLSRSCILILDRNNLKQFFELSILLLPLTINHKKSTLCDFKYFTGRIKLARLSPNIQNVHL